MHANDPTSTGASPDQASPDRTPPAPTPQADTQHNRTASPETPHARTPPGQTPPGQTPPGQTPPGQTPHSRTPPGQASPVRTSSFTLNRQPVAIATDPDRTLLDVLRAEFRLTAPKYGCGLAQCGSCTVLVDGQPARACVLRLCLVEGRAVTTMEGLADPETGALHPVQQGFLDCEGAQCGYCLNGMVMTAVALLQAEPHPDVARVREALRHNLCRCGTHTEIVASVLRAADLMEQAG